MFDVVLIGGAALFQLVVTWYAVDISVREHRVRNGVIIGIVGLAAIILTVWAAYDSTQSQEKLSKEISEMRKQLSGAQVGLSLISLRPTIQPLTPENGLKVILVFSVSEGTAKNMRCYIGGFSLPGKETAEQNRSAVAKFRLENAQIGPSIGEDRLSGTTCFKEVTVSLGASEISELVTGERIIYAMGRADWKNDASANFYTEVCKWMDQPKSEILNKPGWHDCSN